MNKRIWSILVVWMLLTSSLSGLIPAAYANEGGEPAPGGNPAPVYAENFENGLGRFTSRFGTMQLSTEEKHSGQYGVQVGSNAAAQGIWYKHNQLLENWTVTAWVYDDMSDSANVIHFQDTDTSSRTVDFWVGYNINGKDNYETRFLSNPVSTTVARSQGWHELTIVNDFTGSMELKVYVDGVLADTRLAFKMKTVTMGNFWAPKNISTTRYWDDFALYDTALTMPDSGEEPEEEAPVREPVAGKTGLGYKAEIELPAIAHSLLLSLKSPDVILNDTKDMLDRTNPLIVPRREPGGVTVPVELLANSLGAQIAWDDSERTVTIAFQGRTGVLKAGDNRMLLDGSSVSLSQPAEVVEGRLFVPLKEVAEGLFSRHVSIKESGLIVVDADNLNLTAAEEEQILEHFSRPGQILFVAADGNDSNNGTLEEPYKTLEAARDRIRSIKAADGLPDGGVTVYVRGGDYSRSEPFALEEQDSGTEAAPIRYAGYFGEKARIHGGVIIPGASFGPVVEQGVRSRFSPEAADHIQVADLAPLGVTAEQIGDIAYQGHGIAIQPSESELFIGNKPLIRARYPNQGYLKITEVIRQGSIPRDGDMNGIAPIFKFRDPGGRTPLWANVADAWIYGFPKYQWADNTIGVKTIDTATLTMELDQPSHYGVGIGQGFYFFNVLEELDQPGEWVLDKENLKAYVYTEENLDSEETAITLSDRELVDFRNVSHVVWENFDLAYTRKNAVNMTGGHHIRLEGNRIYNTGEKAIMAGNYPVADEYDVNSTDRGGRSYTIRSNDIFNIGKGAIHISGGDRQTLEPGNMLIENNHIWNYARLRMEDGIKMYGVGNTISHNKIHDAPKKAIQFGGNDMVVEYNEIYDVLYSVDDMGAVYMGRDLTYQGNVVRHNFFHNITGPGYAGLGVHAVYFDDFTSYGEVYGNLMYKVQNPIKYNGGSGHKTYNNIIYKDTANSEWYADVNNGGKANLTSGVLADNLSRVPYQSEIWQTRYPQLMTYIESNPGGPSNNVFDRNVIAQHKPIGRYHPNYGSVVSNTYETQADIGFLDESGLNFNLAQNSAVYQQIPDFVPLQFDRMGLYADQYRTVTAQTAVITPSPWPSQSMYTVNFYSAGSLYTCKSVAGGSALGSNWPSNPSRSSHTFGGWFDGQTGTGTQYTSSTMINANVDLYAKWTYSGGSSSGGGDGSASQPTIPVANGAVQVNYTASNGTAILSLPAAKVNEIIEKSKLGKADIDLSKVSSVTAASIPKDALAAFSKASLDTTIRLPAGTITLDKAAAASVVKQASGSDVTIDLKQAAASFLTGEQKKSVKTGDIVLDISITSGAKKITAFDDILGVQIPYTGLQSAAVWSLNDKGELEKLDSTFKNGAVSFGLSRLSLYVVGQDIAKPAWVNPFSDVKEADWFYDAVSFLAEKGITNGTSAATFSPDAILTRGQFITMLLKAYGIEPDVNPGDNFADAGNTYYTGYIAAAKARGISDGVGENMFAPEMAITRQEMFTLLYNALKALNKLPVADTGKTLADFTDSSDAASWARSAIDALVKSGTVSGSGSKLDPTGGSTRAQMAQVLYNLLGK